jgi:pimeloyl-ACP methyl ester carboxylesterase
MDRSMRLRDGRILALSDEGDGWPLVWLSGTPGSRRALVGKEAARRAGARIVALERPGFGLSDFKRGRRVVDWPRDVAEVADQLGLARFALAGCSGAGPYLAVCAHAMPERLTRVVVLGAAGPVDAPGALGGMTPVRRLILGLVARSPTSLHVLLGAAHRLMGTERLYRRFMLGGLAPCDQAVVARPEVRSALQATTREALARGVRGFAWELALLARPWGFALEDIRAEVHVWHGEEDRSTPAAMARYVAGRIPGSRARFFPGEGHFFWVDRWDEILRALAP